MEVEWKIASAIAYIFLGVIQASTDLSQERELKPAWACWPSLKGFLFGFLFVCITWPLRPFMRRGQTAREIVFKVFEVLFRFAVFVIFYWGHIVILQNFIQSLKIVVIVSVLVAPITGSIIFPVVNFLLIPIIFLLTLPLAVLFPLKKDSIGKD